MKLMLEPKRKISRLKEHSVSTVSIYKVVFIFPNKTEGYSTFACFGWDDTFL